LFSEYSFVVYYTTGFRFFNYGVMVNACTWGRSHLSNPLLSQF
jgi:hypothetical protein